MNATTTQANPRLKHAYMEQPKVDGKIRPGEDEIDFYDRVGLQIRAQTSWCIAGVKDFNKPAPQKWQHATMVALEEYLGTSEAGAADYEIVSMATIKAQKDDFTWLELWMLTDLLWPTLWDPDHIFIEGFEFKADTTLLVPFFGS